MQEQEIVSLLRHLGVAESSIEVDSDRGWVRSSCPFAPWTHENGYDASPSFGMSIVNETTEDLDKRTAGYCFTCMSDIGAKSPAMLVQMLWILSGQYPRSASRIVSYSMDSYDIDFDAKLNFFDPHLSCNDLKRASENFYKVFKYFRRLSDVVPGRAGFRDLVQDYLLFRKIPIPIQRIYDVRYSTLDGIIGFPMTTEAGDICHMRIRKPYTKYIRTLSQYYFKEMPHMDDVEFPRILDTAAMFGLHLVQRGKPIYVVEGEIDAMVWCSLGFSNVVASATTSVTPSQFNRLFSLTNTLVFGFDNDKAGRLITEKAIKEAKKAGVNVYHINWAAAGIKDAGAVATHEDVNKLVKAIKKLT